MGKRHSIRGLEEVAERPSRSAFVFVFVFAAGVVAGWSSVECRHPAASSDLFSAVQDLADIIYSYPTPPTHIETSEEHFHRLR